ncbi:MAG: hypothetical protein FWD33_02975, partial [Alphaproteobacteria bacterium]|nr:hypothetical protein [Alphaproteobacteria bacterium]
RPTPVGFSCFWAIYPRFATFLGFFGIYLINPGFAIALIFFGIIIYCKRDLDRIFWIIFAFIVVLRKGWTVRLLRTILESSFL